MYPCPESWILHVRLDATKFRPRTVLTILRQGDRLHGTTGASGQTDGRGQTEMERRGEL